MFCLQIPVIAALWLSSGVRRAFTRVFLPLDELELNQGCKDEQKADAVWNQLGNMRRPDGQLRFHRLVRVAKLVLTMPHSNAAEERVFSMIRKNKTPFRPNLDPSETLGSIITIKMELEQRDTSRKFVFPPQLLSAAKSATRSITCCTAERSVLCTLVESSFSYELDKLY